MFQIGDQVIYGGHGICTIVAQENRVIDKKQIRYLVLEPVEQAGACFYVPADNPVAVSKLHHIIDRASLEQLLQSNQIHQDCWISDENQRKQRYRALLGSGNRAELLQMIFTVHTRKSKQLELGRRLHLCDENFLKDAEKMLNAEFALVLGIKTTEVGDYVRAALEDGTT